MIVLNFVGFFFKILELFQQIIELFWIIPHINTIKENEYLALLTIINKNQYNMVLPFYDYRRWIIIVLISFLFILKLMICISFIIHIGDKEKEKKTIDIVKAEFKKRKTVATSPSKSTFKSAATVVLENSSDKNGNKIKKDSIDNDTRQMFRDKMIAEIRIHLNQVNESKNFNNSTIELIVKEEESKIFSVVKCDPLSYNNE